MFPDFGFVSTVNAYTDNGWILMNSPLQAGSGIIYTCAVTLDSTTAMLIGGMTVIEVILMASKKDYRI
jgi:hypothetical protein